MTTLKITSFWFSCERDFEDEKKLLIFVRGLKKEHVRQKTLCRSSSQLEEMKKEMEVPDLTMRINYIPRQLSLNF